MSNKNLELESQKLIDKLIDLGMYDLSRVTVPLVFNWLSEQDADKSPKVLLGLLEDYLMANGLVEVRL